MKLLAAELGLQPLRTRIFLPILATIISLANSFASESADAYWGSFGERMGRIEGVFLKTDGVGFFIGYDEEREIGAFSANVEWDLEGRLSFSGFLKSEDSEFLIPTTGIGRAFEQRSAVLLESDIDHFEIHFESYSRSAAELARYKLKGEVQGELFVVVGESGESYALFIDQSGVILGGERWLDKDSGDYSILTKRGDRFEFRESSILPEYTLADGRRGHLVQISPQPNSPRETQAAQLTEVWNSNLKTEKYPADALHFIVEGEGKLNVELSTTIVVDIRKASDLGLFKTISIELFRLDENDEWQLLFSSLPVLRTKTNGLREFEVSLVGRLPASLPGGTYLVQIANLHALEAFVESRAVFEESANIRVVNGSTFYQRESESSDHRLGFELVGAGLTDVLVRNVGPGLSFFDMTECTEDPTLTINQYGLKSWKNEDWGMNVSPKQIASQGANLGAFPLVEDSKDSAISLSIGEGVYEAYSRGSTSDFGYEIIEFYVGSN